MWLETVCLDKMTNICWVQILQKTTNNFFINSVPLWYDAVSSQKNEILSHAGIRGLLEKYPTFGREKATGLPGALDT